jgi:hypothetical protein
MKLAKLLIPALLSGFIAFPAFAADEQQNAQNTVAAAEQQSANTQENLATSNDPLHAEKEKPAKKHKEKKHRKAMKKPQHRRAEADGSQAQQQTAEQQPNQNS